MRNVSKITITILVLICLYFAITLRWKGENNNAWKDIISSDGKGYYAYLPAFFIYNDLQYKFLNDKKTLPTGYSSSFLVKTEKGKMNKYFCGVALLQSPFFLLAEAGSLLSGYANNGYSLPFQIAISIAAIFYLALGLWFLRRLLLLFNIPEITIMCVLALFLFGTNLFYYTSIAPSMSHVYSFSAISMFLYYSKKLFLKYSTKSFLTAFIFLLLIALIRPNNLLIISILPFLAENFSIIKRTVSEIWDRPIVVIYAICIVILFSFIQIYIYYKQTGEWFIWSYKGEGFNFSHPEIMNSLFGFRKGLFIYTPLILISLLGLIPIFKKNKFQFFSYLIFLFIVVYITSSWWNWYFGSSFGLRPYIDYYPVFALLLAVLFISLHSFFGKLCFYSICTLFLIINGIQTYQYIHGIIHPENMNFEKYQYVFLKTGNEYRNVIGGNNDVVYGRLGKMPFVSSFNDFESQKNNWSTNSVIKMIDTNWEGEHVSKLDSVQEFSPSYKNQDLPLHEKLFLKISLWKLEMEKDAGAQCLLVITTDSSGIKNTSWNGYTLNDFPHSDYNKWKKLDYEFILPEINSKNESISIYVWNPQKKVLYIDNMNVELFHIEND